MQVHEIMYIQSRNYKHFYVPKYKDYSMRFYVPTDIYVEKNCVKNHALQAREFGADS